MRLLRSSPETPGITRRRAGKGFSYRDARGAVIADAEVRARIAALAIPPAWTEVWICPEERGHVQATGLDADGRRQYRYHEAWSARADRRKYARVRELAGCTGPLRARVTRDLRGGDPEARALAIAARLIDALGMRVGEERYALERGTIGALTLGWQHVTVGASGTRFDFPAKSGVRWQAELADEDLAAALRSARAQRAGSGARIERVTEWVDDAGDARRTSSRALAAYLAEASTCTVTPKDLRTLIGSRTAAEHLARTGPVAGIRNQDRVIREAVVAVAERLRNTPAVARSSYIDPRVIERYRRGRTAALGRSGVSDAALAELLS
ncbi:DNA topoisomerase IB [Microcella daejeonensis]|uniref:DNA topoisomerase IB n=1 Tax=Microcella daejeonensis TaxID=2994971 RepID=UPI0022705502|nr:DNA topoisomerase IB [Microcella daejeonensis]WAB83554.1 DNA topoisomerase IB [Microcella daejeonensis]